MASPAWVSSRRTASSRRCSVTHGREDEIRAVEDVVLRQDDLQTRDGGVAQRDAKLWHGGGSLAPEGPGQDQRFFRWNEEQG